MASTVTIGTIEWVSIGVFCLDALTDDVSESYSTLIRYEFDTDIP